MSVLDHADTIAKRYLAGETMQQIADDLGVSRERIRQVLRHSAGITGRSGVGGRSRCIADRDRLLRPLIEQGMTRAEIEAATGMSSRTILAAATRMGLTITTPTERIRRQVVDLWWQGLKQTEIARELGSSQAHVSQLLIRSGIRSEPGLEHEQEILARYQRGEPVASIAQDLMIATQTVVNRLTANGLYTPKQYRRRKAAA